MRHVNLNELLVSAEKIKPPGRRKKWFSGEEEFLTVTTLAEYEAVIGGYRRSVELASATKKIREQKYRKAVEPKLDTIKHALVVLGKTNAELGKTYISCAKRTRGVCWRLRWDGITALQNSFERASSECESILKDEEFTDLVMLQDRAACIDAAAKGRARTKNLIAYLNDQDDRQLQAAQVAISMEKAPR